MLGGVVSASKMGTIADPGPMPKPRKNRGKNMSDQVLANACQKQAKAEKRQVKKMVPLRPK